MSLDPAGCIDSAAAVVDAEVDGGDLVVSQASGVHPLDGVRLAGLTERVRLVGRRWDDPKAEEEVELLVSAVLDDTEELKVFKV